MLSLRDRIIWILYLLIGIILLLGYPEHREIKTDWLSRTVYSPLLSSTTHIKDLFAAHRKNKELSVQLAENIIRINNLENHLDLTQLLANMDNSHSYYQEEMIDFTVASVIAYRGDYANRILVIDKGRSDGVRYSQPVISEKGIAGKIIAVFQKHSLVLPINNSQFKLGVMSRENNVQGLLEADVSGTVYMGLIKSGSRIGIGDVIVTSGISVIFPRNYPVGRVVRLARSPVDNYMRAVIEPFNEINNVEKLIVLFYEKELPEETEDQTLEY